MDAVAGFFDFAIGGGIALHGNFDEGRGVVGVFGCGDFEGLDVEFGALVGDAAMPIIALGDGFSHVVGRGVFVLLADLCALEFLGFGREDDVEGVFGPVSHHHGDFGAIKIGVGENEFVGTGSEVEVEIPIEARLSEFRPIAVKNLYHG